MAKHDIDGLKYETQKLHKRKIAGKSVHLISRAAYRRLTRGRFAAKLGDWKNSIFRNITRVGRKTLKGKS